MLLLDAATVGRLIPIQFHSSQEGLCLRFISVALRCVRGARVLLVATAGAQSVGNSGSINGTVVDSTGAVVPKAKVEIRNPVSGFDRSTTTDSCREIRVHEYSVQPVSPDGDGGGIRGLRAGRGTAVVGAGQCCHQTAGGGVDHVGDGGGARRRPGGERSHVPHRRGQESVRQAAAGKPVVVGEFAGDAVHSGNFGGFQWLFHGLGDHAENSFSVDGQPITDQQSKVFSNQIPLDAIQSMEVISGAPPAEYGDKTSVVINVTTQSGQGVTTPHGSLTTSYGSFGTSNVGLQSGVWRTRIGGTSFRPAG